MRGCGLYLRVEREPERNGRTIDSVLHLLRRFVGSGVRLTGPRFRAAALDVRSRHCIGNIYSTARLSDFPEFGSHFRNDDDAGRSRSMRHRFYERGSSMVENAIVLGVLMLLLFGIIDFGRALYTYHMVDNAARLGARFAMVRGANCSHTTAGADPWPCPIVPPDNGGEIQQFVQKQSVLLGLGGNVTVTPSWTGQDANGNPYPGCDQDGTYEKPGCPVNVTVTYTFRFLAPFVSTATIAMRSTSQMVISQ